MSLSTLSKSKLSLILLSLFFFIPSANISIFYGLVASLCIVFVGKPVYKNKMVNYLIIFFFTWIVIGASYRSVFYESSFSIFAELIRVLFPCIIFLFIKKAKINTDKFLTILLVWCMFDVIVSALQFSHIRLGFIESIYYSESSLTTLKLSSPRTLGFFSGVAEHGVFFMLIFVWSYTQKFINGSRDKRFTIIFICSLISLFTSQSKTSLVGALVAVFIITLFFGRIYARLLIATVITAIILSLDFIFTNFYQFKKLALVGLQSSSFLVREKKWGNFIEPLLNDPILFVLGAGRAQLAQYGSTFDSDYIFIFSVFGAVFLLSIYLFLGFVSVKYSTRTREGKDLSLIAIFISIIIAGVAVTPLLNPTSQMLLVLLYWNSINARKLHISAKM